MPPEKISSLQNPRVKQLVKLRDRRPRGEAGVVLAQQLLDLGAQPARLAIHDHEQAAIGRRAGPTRRLAHQQNAPRVAGHQQPGKVRQRRRPRRLGPHFRR